VTNGANRPELDELPKFEWRKKDLLGSVVALQEWEGAVLEVGDETFTARLNDLTKPSNPPEFTEISLAELASDSDVSA